MRKQQMTWENLSNDMRKQHMTWENLTNDTRKHADQQHKWVMISMMTMMTLTPLACRVVVTYIHTNSDTDSDDDDMSTRTDGAEALIMWAKVPAWQAPVVWEQKMSQKIPEQGSHNGVGKKILIEEMRVR